MAPPIRFASVDNFERRIVHLAVRFGQVFRCSDNAATTSENKIERGSKPIKAIGKIKDIRNPKKTYDLSPKVISAQC